MTKYEVLRGCWIIFVGLFGYDQFVTKIRKTMDKRSQLETSKKVGTLANARTATTPPRRRTAALPPQPNTRPRSRHHDEGAAKIIES